MFIILILLAVFSFNTLFAQVIFSTQEPYNVPDRSYNNVKDVTTLKNNLAQRNQGYAGHCFAFSTASALDYHLCNHTQHFKFRDLCSNNDPIVSTLNLIPLTLGVKLGSQGENGKVIEGGSPSGILQTLEQNDPSLLLETCAPYEKYLNYLETFEGQRKNGETLFEAAKRVYDEQLQLHYSCGDEFARTLSSHTSVMDIGDILSFSRPKENTFEELMFKSMIPGHCYGTDKRINIYKEITFDSRQGQQFLNKSKVDYEYAYNTVKEQLGNDTPVIINFFTGTNNEQTKRMHSALITGMKKACNNQGKCKILFKIQNSYDTWWQNKFNDGWIEADPLIERSAYTNPALVWVKKK